MVMQSSNISGLVGGQMAMFSNQQSYAQQISGLYGTGPVGQTAGMQNPFPSDNPAGNALIGATGMAGGVIGGASLAGGFMGGAAGLMDPFTGVGRSFMAGRAAMGGAGMLGMAGGMAAALPAAGAYALGGAAIMGTVQNFAEGMQNTSDVGMMAGAHMGPQFGQAGARPGGQMSRTNIKEMTSVLEELAGDDVRVTMESLKRLMDKAGQSGMLQGIGNAQQFKTKFGGMVKQLKTMADAMGTSIEEAAPLFGQMQQMGMWSARDILGTGTAMKAVGAQAQGHLAGAMGRGSQTAWALGGDLGSGATQSRKLFQQVQAAQRVGVLSEEELREATGGVGGAQGQEILTNQMQQTMAQFVGSPMGRLMTAALGEVKEGVFTGRLDTEAMKKFQAGELSVSQLQQRGQQRNRSSARAAASFEVKQPTIGQEMMARGGMVMVGQAISKMVSHGGYDEADENTKNIFIQQVTGIEARAAKVIIDFTENIERIQAETDARTEATLRDTARVKAEERKGIGGAWDAIGGAIKKGFKPVREAGSAVWTGAGESIDAINNALLGRTPSMQEPGVRARSTLRRGMRRTTGDELGASLAEQWGLNDTSVASLVRTEGVLGAIGGMTGLWGGGSGSGLDLISKLGAETRERIGFAPLPEGFQEIDSDVWGGGPKRMVRVSDAPDAVRFAKARANDRTAAGLGFSGTKRSRRPDLERAKLSLRRVFSGLKFAAGWADKKGELKGDPSAQVDELMSRLDAEDGPAADALRKLATTAGGPSAKAKLMNAIALTMEELDMDGHAPDWEAAATMASDLGVLNSQEAFDKAISKSLFHATALLEGTTKDTSPGVRGGRTGYMKREEDEATLTGQADLREVMQGPYGADIGTYLTALTGKGGLGAASETRFGRAISKGNDPAVMRIAEMLQGISGDKKRLGLVGQALTRSGALIGASTRDPERRRIQELAQEELINFENTNLGLKNKRAQGRFGRLLETYAGEDFRRGEPEAVGRAEQLIGRLARNVGKGDRERLQGSGGIGFYISEVSTGIEKVRELELGRDTSMRDVTAAIGHEMSFEMRKKIEDMLGDDFGLNKEERGAIEKMYVSSAARGGPGASRGGRGEMLARQTELLNITAQNVTESSKQLKETADSVNLLVFVAEANEGKGGSAKQAGLKVNTGKAAAPSSVEVD